MGTFLKNILSEPPVAPMFVNIAFFVLFFYFCFGLISDSIAQQQGTEAAEGVLRASQGRLYPPWSLMLAIILVMGSRAFGSASCTK